MSQDTGAPLSGGCGCGGVRFEITASLASAAYCHCTRCQRRSGTAVQASARVVPGSVVVTAGQDLLRGWAPGGGFEKLFCGDCGSALFGRDPASGELAAVRLGAIDGDPGVRPSARQFVAYAAPWEPIPDDGLPRFAERIELDALPATPAEAAVSYVMTARLPAAGIEAFNRYEQAVLPLLAAHGGRLTRRLRSSDGLTEVHLVEFPSTAAYESYRKDSRRQRLGPLLDESGASIELLELYGARA